MDLKMIVIYKSESGFTKKIAQRIADELHADIIDIKSIKKSDLSSYTTIIYGGAVHAQRIIGLNKAKAILKKLNKQFLVVFAVGSAAPDSFSIPVIKKHNIPEHAKTEFFYFRGGYDKKALSLPSKIIMSIVSTLVFKNIQKRKPEFKDILAMMKDGGDYTQTEDISPLISFVNHS
jgi:menaquinone-dependent protoporphyrinogen IX oxidase